MPENTDITIPDGRYKGYIKVHADGGACHGTPLRAYPDGGHYCTKCKINPDMQSTEFWAPHLVKR